jgi:hypothetical protein
VSLTVEDGTGVAGADTYASVSYTQAYAAKRGLSLPIGAGADDAIEVLLTKALDYFEANRASLQGYKTAEGQSLQYPRKDVYIDGNLVASNTIPKEVLMVQAQLACDEYATPGVLQPNSDGREIVRERIEGAIETEWAQTGDSNSQPQLTKARALIAPLLRKGCTTVRG